MKIIYRILPQNGPWATIVTWSKVGDEHLCEYYNVLQKYATFAQIWRCAIMQKWAILRQNREKEVTFYSMQKVKLSMNLISQLKSFVFFKFVPLMLDIYI